MRREVEREGKGEGGVVGFDLDRLACSGRAL